MTLRRGALTREPILKAANPRERHYVRERALTDAADNLLGAAAHATATTPGTGPHSTPGACPGTRPKNVSPILKDVSAAPAQRDVLSVRAENVLKELAAELTGEDPPSGRWAPSSKLLRKLSYGELQAARNCGPQTTDEIVRWARSQGVVIERPFHAGKSLSAMWRDIIAKSSTGKFTKAEIAEALERSLRRKNTRIPVAVQNIVLKILNATGQ
jgi:hypothetical protein